MSATSDLALHQTHLTSVRHTDTTRFFVLAFAITWLCLAMPTLAALSVVDGPAEDHMALAPIAIFGPALAALIATRREAGWEGVRTLLRGLRAPRVHPGWYLLALALPGLVYVAARSTYALLPSSLATQQATVPWALFPRDAQHIMGMLLVPLGEEIGWRGYALPRLIARYGIHRATFVLGVLWGVWHLPMLLSAGFTATQVGVSLVMLVAGNVMFTWFYQRTSGSLLLAVLLHMGAHLYNPSRDVPGSTVPLVLAASGYVAFAALLLTCDRHSWVSPVERASPR